jgi:hypothetical protein
VPIPAFCAMAESPRTQKMAPDKIVLFITRR